MGGAVLSEFSAVLEQENLVDCLREGLIGDHAVIEGHFGARPLIYADYVASGRALEQIETFVLERVLPYYSNSHTEDSHCGRFCTQLRQEARQYLAKELGATDEYSVLFSGAGATAGVNKLVNLMGLAQMVNDGENVVVLVGPYEHHSNLLPWRETGAQIIEISESVLGGPDLEDIEKHLRAHQGADCVVGTFSAASNVTGIVTDAEAVSRLLRRFGAVSIWDYACAAPYLPISMDAGTDSAKDAIVYSSHKFTGGPGATGVTVVRKAIAATSKPTMPGGGTVTYVSPWNHVYSDSLVHREEAGTPNVIGDIRAAMVYMVKQALGLDWLQKRQAVLRERALQSWQKNSLIELLGSTTATQCLPIFSFRVRNSSGGYIHHQLFTRLLSDVHGIQARGGCACAGAYGHRLLGLDKQMSDSLLESLMAGNEIEKPGWIRLNLSALMRDEKIDEIIQAVNSLTQQVNKYENCYTLDKNTARFVPIPTGRDLHHNGTAG